MGVSFNLLMRCWVFDCPWGCFEFDFEGEQEALDAYFKHECPEGK